MLVVDLSGVTPVEWWLLGLGVWYAVAAVATRTLYVPDEESDDCPCPLVVWLLSPLVAVFLFLFVLNKLLTGKKK